VNPPFTQQEAGRPSRFVPHFIQLAFCLGLVAPGLHALSSDGGGGGSGSSGGGGNIPTGGSPSPLFGAQPYTQKLLLFEEFGTQVMPTSYGNYPPLPQALVAEDCPPSNALDQFLRQPLYPAPSRECNELSENPWTSQIEQYIGRQILHAPGEGRPPGEGWSHQRYTEFPPAVYFQSAQTGARTNGGVRDTRQRHNYRSGEFGPGGLYNTYQGAAGPGTTRGIEARFHPNMPKQDTRALWTFDGTFPPKLLQARYGMPVLFRHYNALPIDPSANMGFGTHTITTHEHNGHNPAESDGYTHAFIFPGQYYDYRWPMILAGHDTMNVTASDPRSGAPDGNGGIRRVRGDFRETMSTHWFHDHMLDFTAQNVYKGNAAMMNYYSSIDRGNEAINDGVNLRLPSGTALDWGNRDYDVNLLIADKAWDRNGQLFFNPFNTDGFLGDQVLVNWQYRPYMDVRARRYRFRILNGAVSRYFKLALVDQNGSAVPFHMIANDGNIMEHSVAFDGSLGTQRGILPEIGIAERYDIVVDFGRFQPGKKLYLVNVLEHEDGRKPKEQIPLSEILSGDYHPVARDDNGDGFADRWEDGDPCVGKIMEFRVAAYSGTDLSMNPADFTSGKRTMIPLPRPSENELRNARHRTFEFGRSSGTDEAPWTIKTDGGQAFGMDPERLSAAPNLGELSADGMGHIEIWKLSTGGGWSHPVHIHFEEGILLSRDGQPVPEWEKWARKDVYRIGDGPDTSHEIEFSIRFREFAGSYMEHCHNTQHEDTAMLLRWDIERPGQLALLPAPIPSWDGVQYVPSFALPTARTGDGFGVGGTGSGGGGGGATEVLQATTVQYSPTRGWRLQGTSAGAAPGTELRVRARVGPTLAGTLIGSTRVRSDGTWQLRVESGPQPDTTNTVSFESTGGGQLLAVPLGILP